MFTGYIILLSICLIVGFPCFFLSYNYNIINGIISDTKIIQKQCYSKWGTFPCFSAYIYISKNLTSSPICSIDIYDEATHKGTANKELKKYDIGNKIIAYKKNHRCVLKNKLLQIWYVSFVFLLFSLFISFYIFILYIRLPKDYKTISL